MKRIIKRLRKIFVNSYIKILFYVSGIKFPEEGIFNGIPKFWGTKKLYLIVNVE